MDVTKLLEADHRSVEDLFDRIDRSEGAARWPLIDELVTAVKAHMALEEHVLYPAMEPVTGDESVREANTEHRLARSALDDMVDLAPDDPGFGAALEATRAGIAHHIEEEEGEVFPQLRKDGTVLGQIATPFMQTRLELGLPMPAEALAAAATKDELLTEARNAGLDVSSSATKQDVAEQLETAMTGAA